MDEAELIARSREGSLDAFNQLVERTQQQLYALAYRMLGHREAAEDATQEAFISAYRNIRNLKGSNFRAWVMRIAVNACYDQLRQRQRRSSVSLDELLDHAEPPVNFPDPGETPEAAALRGDVAQALQRGLALLPPDQRATVLLSDVHGLSYEEISAATGASLGTVKSRLCRARAALRDFLQHQGELPAIKVRQHS